MLVCCIITGSVLVQQNQNEMISTAAVVFILIFVIGFQFGPGPIPAFITSELFKPSEKAIGVAITTIINWIANAAVGLAYPHINEAIGGNVFFIFAGINVLSLLFIYLIVPETRNRNWFNSLYMRGLSETASFVLNWNRPNLMLQFHFFFSCTAGPVVQLEC